MQLLPLITSSLGALAVAAIFYTYRDFVQAQLAKRQRILRERMTYMLWVMANQED